MEPDLDDGVRLNIGPFVKAGVLAPVPNLKYGLDRGKNVPSSPWYGMFKGERRNDHYTTLAEKHEARRQQRNVEDETADRIIRVAIDEEQRDGSEAKR